jgi:hypothetical protein
MKTEKSFSVNIVDGFLGTLIVKFMSGRGNLLVRQKAALARLEATYEKFKAAKEDKKPWDSTRNGRVIHHQGRKYADECARMATEIKNLKAKISKGIK